MAKKLGLLGVAALSLFMFSTQALAAPFPWLDFMGNFSSSTPGVYDANFLTDSLTDASSTIRYKDGTLGFTDPMYDLVFPPFSVYGLDITLDFTVGSESLSIKSNTSGGVFTSDLEVDPNFDFVSPSGQITVLLMPGSSYSGPSSQWYDEFSVASLSSPYDGQLILNFNTSTGGIQNISGKLAPVPEPGTIILLGSGLVGLAFYGRHRKKS